MSPELTEEWAHITRPDKHLDHEDLERLQHWVQHASVYTIAGLPVPGWVWQRMKGILDGR